MLDWLCALLTELHRYMLAFWRDLKGARMFIKTKTKFRRFEVLDSNVYDEFEKLAKKHPQKACIIFNESTWTYKDMFNYSNHVACVFRRKFDLKKGDCVSLFMENKPEFVGLWLGLSKLGVITALINTNLKNDSLLHCINIAKSKCVVFGSSLEESIETISDKLKENDVQLVIEGDVAKKLTYALSLEKLFSEHPLEIIQASDKISNNDIMMYVYTSGTTGLPKPAVIKQSRFYAGGILFYNVADLRQDDVVMVTLPIYHGNGGIIGIGTAICSGVTVVLRKKFSASNFWKECIQYKCTAFVYVGEICRFLVNQPPSPIERQHSVRVALGNGMRANIWKQFDERFNVKCFEFYGASEGNCTLLNADQKVGSCGFVPLLNSILKMFPVHVIKVDEEMNPIRDANGFCIKCKPGEKGLLVGIIGKSPEKAYSGYANNSQASSKKIVENVFKQGQRAFNSGDQMMIDKYGYVYFCDRLGDTYRWKGENVSTTEVENIISKHLNLIEVVVYGVEIPSQEGRAGMAAINSDPDSIDLPKLTEKLKLDLPPYARPLFLRFTQSLEHTGTFKATKTKLVQESYDVRQVKDALFYFDSKQASYKQLTLEAYENILNGNVKL